MTEKVFALGLESTRINPAVSWVGMTSSAVFELGGHAP
jgi:hypothetical protein